MGKLIYISGPITGIDPAEASYRFMQVEARLRRRGIPAINPMAAMETLPRLTHEQYMTICFAMMEPCDTIYMMHGWEKSNGAKRELKHAIQHGMKIVVEHENAISGEPLIWHANKPMQQHTQQTHSTSTAEYDPRRLGSMAQTVFVRDGKPDIEEITKQLNKQCADELSISLGAFIENLIHNAGN